jgi:hypothetical protein
MYWSARTSLPIVPCHTQVVCGNDYAILELGCKY